MSEFASARPCKLGGKLAPVKRPQRKADDGAELLGAPLSRNSSAAFSRWSARRLRSFPVCATPLLLCTRRVLRTACLPKGGDVRRRIRSAGSGRIPAEPRGARYCLHDFALLFWVTMRAVAADAKVQPQTRIGEINHGIEQLEKTNALSRIQHHGSP